MGTVHTKHEKDFPDRHKAQYYEGEEVYSRKDKIVYSGSSRVAYGK